MATLRVIADYACRELSYRKGSTIEVSEEEKKFLMTDAPGCFKDMSKGIEELSPDFSFDRPAADRMIHTAVKK